MLGQTTRHACVAPPPNLPARRSCRPCGGRGHLSEQRGGAGAAVVLRSRCVLQASCMPAPRARGGMCAGGWSVQVQMTTACRHVAAVSNMPLAHLTLWLTVPAPALAPLPQCMTVGSCDLTPAASSSWLRQRSPWRRMLRQWGWTSAWWATTLERRWAGGQLSMLWHPGASLAETAWHHCAAGCVAVHIRLPPPTLEQPTQVWHAGTLA